VCNYVRTYVCMHALMSVCNKLTSRGTWHHVIFNTRQGFRVYQTLRSLGGFDKVRSTALILRVRKSNKLVALG